MGNDVSKPSDIFYPDNPKRRARAYQLRNDIVDYSNQFKEVQQHRDEVLKEIKPRLKEFLNKYGYSSPEELDQSVQNTLKGSALSDYLRIRQQIDKRDELVSAVFQITSIISVASGVFIGGLVVLGVMTGGAGLSAIGLIGAGLGIIAAIAFLFDIFEGAEERANMRKCIHDLALERVKARAALEGMKAISNWVESIRSWLDEPLIIGNEEIMKRKIEGDFSNDFNKSKRPYVVQYLTERDRERGAWMNEDPDWRSGPYDIIPSGILTSLFSEQFLAKNEPYYYVPEQKGREAHDVFPDFLNPAPKVSLEYESENASGSLELIYLSSDKTSCTGLGPKDDRWAVIYESGPQIGLNHHEAKLSDFRFLLRNVTSGLAIEGCKLNILEYIG